VWAVWDLTEDGSRIGTGSRSRSRPPVLTGWLRAPRSAAASGLQVHAQHTVPDAIGAGHPRLQVRQGNQEPGIRRMLSDSRLEQGVRQCGGYQHWPGSRVSSAAQSNNGCNTALAAVGTCWFVLELIRGTRRRARVDRCRGGAMHFHEIRTDATNSSEPAPHPAEFSGNGLSIDVLQRECGSAPRKSWTVLCPCDCHAGVL
jgi:hypothetical protein